MSDKAIIVSDLYKRYDLGSINSGTVKDDLKIWWSRMRGKEDPTQVIGEEKSEKEYWALKGLDFEIKKGESVGIIGKNGAGKSTLLKILSRVTAPTKGKIKINGRIASLLEVGTGFHPDLSGRENIFMNGAILGMTRIEISSKLDEIIAFSGVEKHIDTPVKRYSSGMYVRLAFAVAAHLESEILIVDEVLAVGDAEFQKKCLGKMSDVSSKDGRTVLYVSHQLNTVQNLCKRAILLHKGVVMEQGDTNFVIDKYMTNKENNFAERTRKTDSDIYLSNVLTLDPVTNQKKDSFFMGSDVALELTIGINTPKNFVISINITNSYEELVAHLTNLDDEIELSSNRPGVISARILIKNLCLSPQKYNISVWCGNDHHVCYFNEENCASINVIQDHSFIKRHYEYPRHAKIALKSLWETQIRN